MLDDAPQDLAGPGLHQIRRRYVALGLIVLAAILLAALIIIRNGSNPPDSGDAETFSPASGTMLSAATQMPASITNAVGVSSPVNEVTAPAPTRSPTLWRAASGHSLIRPVVFFYGAEFSPYAAAQRWPLVIALARFGTFAQLGQVQSSSTELFPDLWSFTFFHFTYSSPWVTLLGVERYGAVDPSGATYISLQRPDAAEANAVSSFDSTGATFPFLDIANRYTMLGSAFSPSVVSGLSPSDIASDLSSAASPVTQAMVAAANEITAAICTVTGQRPIATCDTHGVEAADQKMDITPAR
jgi:hypothetical protein